jgi:hypothetical protein
MIMWGIGSGFFIKGYNKHNNIFVSQLIGFLSFLLLLMTSPYEISAIIGVIIAVYNWTLGNQYANYYKSNEFCDYTFYSGFSIEFLLILLLLSVVCVCLLFIAIRYALVRTDPKIDNKRLLFNCIIYVLVFDSLFLLLGFLFSYYNTPCILHFIK